MGELYKYIKRYRKFHFRPPATEIEDQIPS